MFRAVWRLTLRSWRWHKSEAQVPVPGRQNRPSAVFFSPFFVNFVVKESRSKPTPSAALWTEQAG